MVSSRSIVLTALLCISALTSACKPTIEPPIVQAPLISAITLSGEPVVRDLPPTTEVVSNCAGVTSPVIKNPTVAVGTAHAVEWEVGGSIGTGVTVGGGVVPGGVDLQASLEGHVANDLTNSIQQSNAWELPADPGTIMEYTIAWREVWQPAYIDVTFMNPEPQIIRIDVMYRTGIQSIIDRSTVTPCSAAAAPQTAPADTPSSTNTSGLVQPPDTPPPPPTNSPTTVGSTIIDIPVNSEYGAAWQVPASGVYAFRIASGAYNIYAIDADCAEHFPDSPGCWRTQIYAYLGCEVRWQPFADTAAMVDPVEPTFTLGDRPFMPTLAAAEAEAIAQAPVTWPLDQDDCLRFVVVDQYNPNNNNSYYGDNRGDDDRAMTLHITGP